MPKAFKDSNLIQIWNFDELFLGPIFVISCLERLETCTLQSEKIILVHPKYELIFVLSYCLLPILDFSLFLLVKLSLFIFFAYFLIKVLFLKAIDAALSLLLSALILFSRTVHLLTLLPLKRYKFHNNLKWIKRYFNVKYDIMF